METDGTRSARQHYSCIVVNGRVAFDAGSLAVGVTSEERSTIRNVVLTHAHLDHIAGLPLFIDDLFPVLTEPVKVHATAEVIGLLETHIFNWEIYPRFSELKNEFGNVIEYSAIEPGKEFSIGDLSIRAIGVNHKVNSHGFLIKERDITIAFTGDTAEMSGFWNEVNSAERLSALFIECAFPNEFEDLSVVSHHLTPNKLESELKKLTIETGAIYAINLKPAYRDAIVSQIGAMKGERVKVLEVGREYEFS
jgi:cAMP phosphodiesterase